MTSTDAPGLPRRTFLRGLLATAFVSSFADKLMPQLPPAPRHLRGMTVPIVSDEGVERYAPAGFNGSSVNFTYTRMQSSLYNSFYGATRGPALRQLLLELDMATAAKAFGGSITKSQILDSRSAKLQAATSAQAMLHHAPAFSLTSDDKRYILSHVYSPYGFDPAVDGFWLYLDTNLKERLNCALAQGETT